jgi:hypothetical protein
MAVKPVKSRKSAKKAPTRRKKAALKDLPSVKASKVVGGVGGVDL